MDSSMHVALTGVNFWKIIGWLANVIFTSRFIVQWYVTEKKQQVTVPVLFWWLSLAGSLLLLSYAIFQLKDWVMIFAYAFPWIPYTRNLIISRQYNNAEKQCPACSEKSGPKANYCPNCGARLAATQA